MLLTLLEFGTLWFWVVAVAVFFIMTAFLENEKSFFAGLTFIGAMVAFYFMGNSGMLAWIKHNPLTLLYYFLGYVGIAGVWALVKWYLFVTGENEKYEEAKTQFLKDNKATALTQALKVKWTKHVEEGYYARDSYSYPRNAFLYPAPQARDHKARVLSWMTYWPCSAFWTLLNDPIRRLMRLIYSQISGMLNAISRHAYRNVENDLVKTTDTEE